MDTKPWYKSKTIWFNVICASLAFAAVNLPMFSGMMTPAHFASFSLFVTVGNGVLRFVSSQGITLFSSAPAP